MTVERQRAISAAISQEAWDSVNLSKEYRELLNAIALEGPLTADAYEVARARIGSHMRGHQRFAELRDLGLIKQTGRKLPTRSNRRACEYELTKAGWVAYARWRSPHLTP